MIQDKSRHRASSHCMLPNSSILPVMFRILLLKIVQISARHSYVLFSVLKKIILTPRILSLVMWHFWWRSSWIHCLFCQIQHSSLLKRNTQNKGLIITLQRGRILYISKLSSCCTYKEAKERKKKSSNIQNIKQFYIIINYYNSLTALVSLNIAPMQQVPPVYSYLEWTQKGIFSCL